MIDRTSDIQRIVSPCRIALFCSLILSAEVLFPHPSYAETKVSGSPQALRIEVKDASIDEVLSALEADLDVTFNSKARPGKLITGSYSGSLSRVLGRILNGQDFFLRSVDGKIQVTLVDLVLPGQGRGAGNDVVKPSAETELPKQDTSSTHGEAVPIPGGLSTRGAVPKPGELLLVNGPLPIPEKSDIAPKPNQGSSQDPLPVPIQGEAAVPAPATIAAPKPPQFLQQDNQPVSATDKSPKPNSQ